MALDLPSDQAKSTRLGRYELLTRIATGGMAEVFVARVRGEGGFERLVAVKRMLPTIAEEEHFAEMFLDEGRIAGQIESPHCVQILDVGKSKTGELFIAMELVRGLPLHRLLSLIGKQRQFMPVPIAVAILAQAAEGLGAAHAAVSAMGEPLGIVHRDVSPQNLLVGIEGRVRVADFGVARAVHRRTSTSTGELKGKLAYFAPEQLRSMPATQVSDVFAMGVVAWETLAMRRLFQGDNPVDTIEKIRRLEPAPLDTLRPDVPAELARTVARALDKDPARRTESASLFAEELRRAAAPADAASLAQFVRRWGESDLAQLEDRIRLAMAGKIDVTNDEIPLPSERSGVRQGFGDDDADAATTVTPSKAMQVVAPPVVPSLAPPPGTQPDGSRVPLGLVAGLAAVLLLAVGGAAYHFSDRGDEGIRVVPLSAGAPTGSLPVVSTGSTAIAHDDTAGAVPLPPPAPPGLVEAEAAAEADGHARPRHRTGGHATTTSAATGPPPPIVAATGTSSPAATEPEPEPVAATEPVREPVRDRRPRGGTETTGAEPETGSGSGTTSSRPGLRGLDDFAGSIH